MHATISETTPKPPQLDTAIAALRFVSMLLIFVCHCFQYYDNELCRWLNVGVPIFFIISGFLYGSKTAAPDPVVFLRKRFRKILLPYYLFLFIVIPLYFVFHRDLLHLKDIFHALTCSGTIKGLGHLWFVGYILFCYIITPYLLWFKNSFSKKPLIHRVLIWLCFMIVVQILGFAFRSYFLPDRVLCYLLGFALADFYSCATKKETTIIHTLLFLLCLVLCSCRLLYNTLPLKSIPSFQSITVRYSQVALGVSLFILLRMAFKNVKYTKFLRISDEYSYHFYIVHLLFILSPFTLMATTEMIPVNCLLALLSSVLSAFILKFISQKVTSSINRQWPIK